jgi:hypothetical protein
MNLAAQFAKNQQATVLLAILGSKYAGKIGTQETKSMFFDQLISLTREAKTIETKLRIQAGDDETLLRLAAAIPIIVGHLCSQDDAAAAAETICLRMAKILAEWPAIASAGSLQLDHLVRQLPIDYQRAYWPLVLTSRAVG